jgi:DNA-directed RNA polymerase specialized sigma24 family protein
LVLTQGIALPNVFFRSEVAEILGRSAGAVGNRWFECRRHIREALESQELGRADLLG